MNPGIHYNVKFLPGYRPLKLHFHWKKNFFLFCFFSFFVVAQKEVGKIFCGSDLFYPRQSIY